MWLFAEMSETFAYHNQMHEMCDIEVKCAQMHEWMDKNESAVDSAAKWSLIAFILVVVLHFFWFTHN